MQLSSPNEGRVVQTDGAVHMVNLRVGTCSCGRYQRNGVPCGHAMACLFRQGLSLDTFLPASLSIETWIATYEAPLPPIHITGLRPQEEEPCNPPLTRVPRGRPKKKREERATYRASRALHREDLRVTGAPLASFAHRCGTCGEAGHNTTTCRRPHD